MFLEKQGLQVKQERGNRIFPITDKSVDVLHCFTKKIKELGIEVKYETRVTELLVEENKILGVKLEDDTILKADKVILATGGKSYPQTGSTGDGYALAKKVGHTIAPLKGSLIPMEAYEKEFCKRLQGLSLKNTEIKIKDKEKNKVIYEDFGEMMFTHFGVSGPMILSGAAHLLRYPEVERKMKQKQIILTIDLKPALTMEKLDLRIQKDFQEAKNKQFKNSLSHLLPQKLIEPVIQLSGITEDKPVNGITKEERRNLGKILKELDIHICNFRPIEEAIITSGGVQIKEINPKTMESKLIQGLYFAGEIIDVDAYTGGFNLQIAYSTGYCAGRN